MQGFDPNKIPDGQYCYMFTGRIIKTGLGADSIEYPETTPCPYYKHIEDIDGFCFMLSQEIEDQCKICKYNWKEDEEYEKWYEENKNNLSCRGAK